MDPDAIRPSARNAWLHFRRTMQLPPSRTAEIASGPPFALSALPSPLKNCAADCTLYCFRCEHMLLVVLAWFYDLVNLFWIVLFWSFQLRRSTTRRSWTKCTLRNFDNGLRSRCPLCGRLFSQLDRFFFGVCLNLGGVEEEIAGRRIYCESCSFIKPFKGQPPFPGTSGPSVS